MAHRSNNTSLLTTNQVAKQLNVHINTVRRWDKKGILRAYRIGPRGDRRFEQDEITALLQEFRNPVTKSSHD